MFSLEEPGGFTLLLDGEVLLDGYGEGFFSEIITPFACDCQASDSPNPPVSPPSAIDYQDFEDKTFGGYWKKDGKVKIKKKKGLDTHFVMLKKKGALFTEAGISTEGQETTADHKMLEDLGFEIEFAKEEIPS